MLKFTRKVSLVHRWLGIALSLMFALWFASGAVLLYVPFPSLSNEARIANSVPINYASLKVTPSEAVKAAGNTPIDSLRLLNVLDQANYVMSLDDGRVLAISGANAQVLAPLMPEAAAQIAAQFSKRKVLAVQGPLAHDQWIVHQRFDAMRPFFRVSIDDALGTQFYVSARTGEVLQQTTHFERSWNWVGAVVHWIYPTVLRQHWAVWDQVVWYLSLAGIVTVLAGLWLGVFRWIKLRRAKGAGVSPFRGWMRWHHLLGLSIGGVVLTWIFSGWLSMDHGRLFSLDKAPAQQIARLRGMPITEAVRSITLKQLETIGSARELEFIALGGKGFILRRDSSPELSLLIPVQQPDAAHQPHEALIATLPDEALLRAVKIAWAPTRVVSIAPIAADDAYGRLRNNSLPETTRRIVLADASASWVHIDAATGQIISVMDRSRRVYRWLFDGLHTFDFPLLNRAGSLWRVLMLLALALGFAFSITSAVLGIRRLKKSFPD